MTDHFTETTSQGFFSRIGNSLLGRSAKSYCRKAKMLITRSTLNLIALVGMLITAFLATALEVRDMNRNSPSLETSNSSDR